MTEQITIRCDRCGKKAIMPDIHVLPLGWERSGMGDDICDECMADISEALKLDDPTHRARLWNRRLRNARS